MLPVRAAVDHRQVQALLVGAVDGDVVTGIGMAQATPVALLAVGTAAALGALDGLRKGLVRYKAAALIALVSLLWSGRLRAQIASGPL